MRLSIWVLGREVLTIATDTADECDDDELGDAMSYPVAIPFGFVPEVEYEQEEAD